VGGGGMHKLKNIFVLVLVLPIFAQNLCSQLPGKGVRISGTVRDPSGAVVAGAHLTLNLSSGDHASVTDTDGAGEFRFSGVGPGRYLILLEHAGFRAFSRKVDVGHRDIAVAVITLELATLTSEVDVVPTDVSVSDPLTNRNSTDIGSRVLTNLPILDGDYVATLSNILDAGAVGTSGQSVIVDGMEVKDAVISQAAVQDIRVNEDPYSAEFWQPGRARIEITTKADNDRFHGSLGFSFRDAVLDARNTFALSKPPEQKRNYDLFLSGPIRKTKGSFSISFTRNEEEQDSLVFAVGPTGPIRQSVPNPMRWTRLSARASHDVSASHRLSFQYSFFGYLNENYGVGGMVLPQAGTNYSIRLDDLTFSDQFILSTNKVNELQVRIERYSVTTTSASSGPKIVVQGAFTSGGAQTDQRNTQSSVALNDTLSWTATKHQVKLGVNIPDLSRNFLDDRSNFGGTFYFSGLASYLAKQPYLLRWQTGTPFLHFGYQEIAGFAQDLVHVTPRLTLGFGWRYDWQSHFPAQKNFAPRASLAYALDQKSKHILRLGAGIFHDRTGPSPIDDLLRYNATNLLEYSLANPSFPFSPPTSGSTTVPSNIVVLAPNARIPYAAHYSLGIERQILSHATLAMTYRGAREFHLFRSVDVNAPPPPDYLVRPDPAFGTIRQIQSEGRQNNYGLDFTFRGNITKYFTGQAQYSLSWTSNNTDGITYFPSNNYNLTGEWGRSGWDRRHRLYLLSTTQVKKWFTLGVVLYFVSGKPYSVTTGTDTYNDGMDNARPPGMPRNTKQGGPYASLDLRLSHDFLLKPKDKKERAITLALESFNALNHASYNTYVSVLTSPLFSQPVSAYPPRRLQLALRFRF
jgi:outer membrane receptor protein involved in Fe transport